VKIPTESRVQWGIAHIRGQAKTWLNNSGLQLHSITWTELGRILVERFPDNNTMDPMELLQTLKQVTTVNCYIDAYEQWMTLMKREKPYLQLDFFVDRFISGLKEGIRHTVHGQKPVSLMSAYWYARLYEKAYLAKHQKTSKSSPSTETK
jgi:hypothetical protein